MFVAIFLEILIAMIDLFSVMIVIFVIFSYNLKNAEYTFEKKSKNQKLFDSL